MITRRLHLVLHHPRAFDQESRTNRCRYFNKKIKKTQKKNTWWDTIFFLQAIFGLIPWLSFIAMLLMEFNMSYMSFTIWNVVGWKPYLEGILPKGPYPSCLRMADRALLAGYPRPVTSSRKPWLMCPTICFSSNTKSCIILENTFICYRCGNKNVLYYAFAPLMLTCIYSIDGVICLIKKSTCIYFTTSDRSWAA